MKDDHDCGKMILVIYYHPEGPNNIYDSKQLVNKDFIGNCVIMPT